jgi:hypothetical protein
MAEREEVLLSLLAYELFRQELQIDASTVDWASVLDEGTRHAVTALFYPGMKQVAAVPEEILGRARGAAIAAAELSEHMLNSQRTVLTLLQEKGIPCAVLKGTSIALYYPHPELRIPGDIDLLVDRDKLHEVCIALEGSSFMLAHTDEKHLCFQKRDLWLEVHPIISVFPDSEKGIFTTEYMLSALRFVQTVKIAGISFPALTGMYQIISLLVHMGKHLSDEGIGLRQLCDWAVTVHAQREKIGEAELALLDSCGLLYFARIVTRLCEKYLGMPPCVWSADAPDTSADALMNDILNSGNFQSQYQRPFWGLLTRGVLMDAYDIENSTISSTIRSYRQYIRSRIRQDFPWAKGRLWIAVFGVFYPLRWIILMLLGKRKKVNLSQAIRFARRREKLLRELRLYK